MIVPHIVVMTNWSCHVAITYSGHGDISGLGMMYIEFAGDPLVIVDLLRYDNFVVCYTESYPQRIT